MICPRHATQGLFASYGYYFFLYFLKTILQSLTEVLQDRHRLVTSDSCSR